MTEITVQRKLEKSISASSFAVAVVLAFTSIAIREDHDITANVLLAMAQFLTLTCTLLGIDYKFSNITTNQKNIDANGKKQNCVVA